MNCFSITCNVQRCNVAHRPPSRTICLVLPTVAVTCIVQRCNVATLHTDLHQTVSPISCHNCRLELVGTKSVFVLWYSCCLPAAFVVHRRNCHTSKFDSCCAYTVLEKSVFYGYLTAASVSPGLPTQFVRCCLVTCSYSFEVSCLPV